MNTHDEIRLRIASLKTKKNAVILAHNYQLPEVQALADHLGDSLELSRIAASTPHSMIVFCGVKFMAETAKVLSPQKTVLLPRLDAGCPMADMLSLEELRALKALHPDAKVVTYVNSSVEIKAESDVCCTSANAVTVVRNLPAQRIIFVPDCNLGSHVQRQVPEKEIILHEGYCYVHNRIKVEDVRRMKEQYPQALVLAHPEVQPAVTALADEILSTSGMLRYVRGSAAREFIVLTEQGILERLKLDHPDKSFYPAVQARICVNMKRTAPADVLRALEEEIYAITIEESLRAKAYNALSAMINYV